MVISSSPNVRGVPPSRSSRPTPASMPPLERPCDIGDGLLFPKSFRICPCAGRVGRHRRSEALAGHQCGHGPLCCRSLFGNHPLILSRRARSSRHHGRSMENGLQGRGGQPGHHHRKPEWGTAAALSHRWITVSARWSSKLSIEGLESASSSRSLLARLLVVYS
jgi:hypothetical protein